MKKAILATKVGMTQIFNADGVLTPVTVLQAGPCVVTQIKTVENDGYSAVQVGFVDKKEKIVNKDAAGKKEIRNRHGVNKAEKGHFAKAGVSCKRYVREFKFENAVQRTHGSRLEIPSSRWFQWRMLQPQQGVQGQEDAGTHGLQADYHPESGGCQSRR